MGKKDSLIANASSDLPGPATNVEQLIMKFKAKNLSEDDLVVLSGVYMIGLVRCFLFKKRIYNESDIVQPKFAQSKGSVLWWVGMTTCPPFHPTLFDNKYFIGLLQKQGLLHSDAAFLASNSTMQKVIEYVNNQAKYFLYFSISVVKMGAIGVLTGENGVILRNCHSV